LALDFFQNRLTTEYGGDTEGDELDLEFVTEGRRLLAIRSFQVLADADSNTAAACCLGELSRMVEEGSGDVGALVLLPGFRNDVAVFADEFLREPLSWLGLETCSIDILDPRISEGAPVPLVRIFLGLSEIPEPVEVSVTRMSARQIVEGFSED